MTVVLVLLVLIILIIAILIFGGSGVKIDFGHESVEML